MSHMRFERYIAAALPFLYRHFGSKASSKGSSLKLVNEFTAVAIKLENIAKKTQLYKVERIHDDETAQIGKSIPLKEVVQVRPGAKKTSKK